MFLHESQLLCKPRLTPIRSVYCASRSLFGLALEGKAPKFLTKCLKNGVPIYSVIVVLLIALLSFLQVSSNTATVLGWFVSLITASQVINYCVMAATYICFYRALKAQGIDRRTLPYRGLFQPYAAWYACGACFFMAFFGGYTVFLPGYWDVSTFLFRYVPLYSHSIQLASGANHADAQLHDGLHIPRAVHCMEACAQDEVLQAGRSRPPAGPRRYRRVHQELCSAACQVSQLP